MVKVFPFKGLRPRPDIAKEIASPPYDVLSVKEAKDIIKTYPNSFLRINKAECEFDHFIDSHNEKVYHKAKKNLNLFIKNGLLIQDDDLCFYLYRLTFNSKCQTGLCCLMTLEDYEKGLIKKHEHTRPEKVKDRAKHIEYLEAQVGPIFSLFNNSIEIENIFNKITSSNPETSFTTDDSVTHDFWVIKELNVINDIKEKFQALSFTYIADGHHRSESAAEVARSKKNSSNNSDSYNYFLQVLFPDNEVNILAYNRIAKIPPNLTVSKLLSDAKLYFNISINDSKSFSPARPNTFGVYAENTWYKMELLDGLINKEDPVEGIDAQILQRYFISPFLKIEDPKTDDRIRFVGGIRGNSELEKRIDSGEFDIAFSLFPTSVSQLLKVANAQKVMPPKSTWFEPKLRSGMVTHLLNS